MIKVVVVVNGGCVTSVFSDDPHVKVEVFDIDNLRDSEMTTGQIDSRLFDATKDLTEV